MTNYVKAILALRPGAVISNIGRGRPTVYASVAAHYTDRRQQRAVPTQPECDTWWASTLGAADAAGDAARTARKTVRAMLRADAPRTLPEALAMLVQMQVALGIVFADLGDED